MLGVHKSFSLREDTPCGRQPRFVSSRNSLSEKLLCTLYWVVCPNELVSLQKIKRKVKDNKIEKRFPLLPFTLETALQKVQAAEDAWNSKDPERVSLAYTVDTEWRNRTEFINGREEVKVFLTRKWAKENGYKLKKELWGFRENRIAVRFEYEWHDDAGNWFRSYGNENWEFDENGYMQKRFASINDLPIKEEDRKL